MLRTTASIAGLFFLLQLAFPPGGLLAARYQRNSSFIGNQIVYETKEDDSLYEIAKQFDVGIDAITAANPQTDPFIPPAGIQVVVPSQWILPDVPLKRGIVINLAEMRLYYFDRDRAGLVTTFPVGIGDEGKDTPLGSFTIIEKIVSPAWYVPQSIREEKPELPAVVPPGPDNPMGSHALRLSRRTVLIHGTDRPWGIGTRNSHGCIRLYQEDIASLFGLVGLHTAVTIVNQPVKAAPLAGHVFLEVHEYEPETDLCQEAFKVLEAKKLSDRVDPEKVNKACAEHTGLLVDVAK